MADESAFESFVRAHTAELMRTAFLLTGTRQSAEDLLQETLSRLFPQWGRVEAADVPLAYVRRAVTNRYVSQTRGPGYRDVAMWELPDRWDRFDLGEVVAARATVWQLLGEIPARQRAAIVLRYFHDVSEEEIAEALGCRASTVRSLIRRGMAAMRAAGAEDVPTTSGRVS